MARTDDETQRFNDGVQAAARVRQEHATIPFPDPTVREQIFWFYVGVMSAREYGCRTPAEFGAFAHGVASQAPASAGAQAVDAIRAAAHDADNDGDQQRAKGLYEAISVLAAHGIISDK